MWRLLMCFCLCAPAVQPTTPNPEERYNFFNIDLLQAINSEVEGNVVVSPASVKIALTTLLEGTSGRTRQELLSTLRLPVDESTIRAIVARTLAPLKSTRNGTEIDLATRLWIGSGLKVRSSYVDILQRYYAGDVHSLNFAELSNSVKTINEWVRQATRGNVKSLVEPSSLSSDTRLLLTSALYFKGKWLNLFDKKATRIRCFNVPNHGCQETYLMENRAKYRYAYISWLDADVIEIPYSDGKTSMLAFLPSNKENDQKLQILSKDLSYISMSALLGSLEETEVLLILPKFTIESKLDLRSPLSRMGIRDMFELTANLSGISAGNSLHVGSILQNARIEVDEDGTIAAAVTGLSIVPLMGSTVPTFRANRPFLFAIVDLETNGTLFAGRIIQPNSVELHTT